LKGKKRGAALPLPPGENSKKKKGEKLYQVFSPVSITSRGSLKRERREGRKKRVVRCLPHPRSCKKGRKKKKKKKNSEPCSLLEE